MSPLCTQHSALSSGHSATTLRHFAALWILFFGGLALWQGLIRERPLVAVIFAGLAAVVGPLGLTRPRMIRPIYLGCLILGFPIGWVLSKLLLALVYYGVFAPIGLFFKVMGRDVLALRFQSEKTSYWSSKPAAADERSYLRQF